MHMSAAYRVTHGVEDKVKIYAHAVVIVVAGLVAVVVW